MQKGKEYHHIPDRDSNPFTGIQCERGRLSGPAITVVNDIGLRMGLKFEPLIPLYIPSVLRLCTRTSKIYISRATECLKTISSCCRMPSLVSLYKEAVQDKSQGLRIAATEALHVLLSTSVRDGLPKKGKWVEDVEQIVKITARDAVPETRKLSRKAFLAYCELWPERVNE